MGVEAMIARRSRAMCLSGPHSLVALVVVALTFAPGPSHGDEPSVTVKPEEVPGTGSEFLRHPGVSDGYGPPISWADIPPWQQTSFFGIRARGRVFLYVVDCSGSMIQENRLGRAKTELRRSVMNLRFGQRFQVIFYNDQPLTMPGGIPVGADPDGKRSFLNWLARIDADGATDPRGALDQAIGLRPDAVFLLSDGEFPEGTVSEVARLNTRKIPIHCVDLAGGLAGDHLERNARDSGGKYASRPGNLQGGP
jgi:hypothetical protein